MRNRRGFFGEAEEIAEGYSLLMSEAPAPESLEELLIQEVSSGSDSAKSLLRNEQVRSENLVAAKFWGPIQYRIVFTFLFFL